MELCYDGHEEVCYDSNRTKNYKQISCPVCEALVELNECNLEVKRLNEEVTELKIEKETLEQQLKELRTREPVELATKRIRGSL